MTHAGTVAATVDDRVPRVVWVGLVAFAFYVIVAAGGGLLIDALGAGEADPVTELALTHLIPLPIAIAAGLVFARLSGWWHDIWTDAPLRRSTPRRWWMWLIPVLLVVQIVALFAEAPWAQLSVSYILIGLVCYLLVGLGEELFTRGILLESVRAHHGETVTLLATALAFGAANSVGSGISGVPVGTIAFQIAVTAMDGVLFYAALRVTGTLWAPILLHGLGDYGRWLIAGDGADHTSGADAITQTGLTLLSAAVLISVILEDRRNRRRREITTSPTGNG
ncbi:MULTISPECIES: type II CAAX endopeptidase family protein [Microbacterium]|uniref:CPBP family intramembrane glutamic endopeptidase n=1 Tax=Microbacterium TaxID=33882 RepID=UPI000D65B1F3|nr:type II CAAX endopeptidase family protein [Microbacterium sp. KCTC 39802]